MKALVARSAAEVVSIAAGSATLEVLGRRVGDCRACPRLVEWREDVAQVKRRAFIDETYWGRAVPAFGPSDATMMILGLAPAAHGANRTGRMFTGDRSGDWLYASLHRIGVASQPTSVALNDGLALRGVYVTAAVHCAPPANVPTPEERDACQGWLVREIELLWPQLRSIVVLGGFGWSALWPALRSAGVEVPRKITKFGHGAEAELDGRTVLGCYHVSQQNTFTGRLTEPMLDEVMGRAATLAGLI